VTYPTLTHPQVPDPAWSGWPAMASVAPMNLVLGWTGSFDQDSAVLHLATGDTTRAATVSFGPEPEPRGDGLLDRATGFLEADTHRLSSTSWQQSGGRLPVGATAVIQTRTAGPAEVTNGSALGHRRRHRTGELALDGRTYRVCHRSRWRTVVEVEGQQIAVLTRRVLSRRTRPLHRTVLPSVQTAVITEPDQLAVVLAATVLGPPGRTGFWGNVGRRFMP
jgi:hypothetical protein